CAGVRPHSGQRCRRASGPRSYPHAEQAWWRLGMAGSPRFTGMRQCSGRATSDRPRGSLIRPGVLAMTPAIITPDSVVELIAPILPLFLVRADAARAGLAVADDDPAASLALEQLRITRIPHALRRHPALPPEVPGAHAAAP